MDRGLPNKNRPPPMQLLPELERRLRVEWPIDFVFPPYVFYLGDAARS